LDGPIEELWYFRTLLVGYSEGLASRQAIAGLGSDSR
jgi:hypothetical protein